MEYENRLPPHGNGFRGGVRKPSSTSQHWFGKVRRTVFQDTPDTVYTTSDKSSVYDTVYFLSYTFVLLSHIGPTTAHTGTNGKYKIGYRSESILCVSWENHGFPAKLITSPPPQQSLKIYPLELAVLPHYVSRLPDGSFPYLVVRIFLLLVFLLLSYAFNIYMLHIYILLLKRIILNYPFYCCFLSFNCSSHYSLFSEC